MAVNHQDKTENKLISTEDIRWGVDRKSKLLVPKRKMQTGFEGKTLWDWLQLLAALAIPLVVVFATIGFGWWQTHLADEQHLQDQQRALDLQEATTLQTYIDDIQVLLLNHILLKSKPTDAVAILARARTLTALQGLDPHRKGVLLKFLYETHLIGYFDTIAQKSSSAIINLTGAELTQTDLTGADLAHTDLTDVNLTGALLDHALLKGAYLTDATLSNADLSYVDLSYVHLADSTLISTILLGANLTSTFLDGGHLQGANLSGATLQGATVDGADLVGTNITQQQLDQVFSCDNAFLPPGIICSHRST